MTETTDVLPVAKVAADDVPILGSVATGEGTEDTTEETFPGTDGTCQIAGRTFTTYTVPTKSFPWMVHPLDSDDLIIFVRHGHIDEDKAHLIAQAEARSGEPLPLFWGDSREYTYTAGLENAPQARMSILALGAPEDGSPLGLVFSNPRTTEEALTTA